MAFIFVVTVALVGFSCNPVRLRRVGTRGNSLFAINNGMSGRRRRTPFASETGIVSLVLPVLMLVNVYICSLCCMNGNNRGVGFVSTFSGASTAIKLP